MPSLNQDVLFSIGKQLIEDGDSDAVYRFVLSGKEPFEAMKRVFSNVTTLELHWDHYIIEWETKCFKFEFNNPLSKFFIHLIGYCVTKLRVWSYSAIYDPVIDKIISKKQLNLLSLTGPFCNTTVFDKFFHRASSFLKNVIIPSSKMTPTFRDCLNLESLTVLGENGYDFALFCCKTSSLEFSYCPKHEYVFFRDSCEDDFLVFADLSHLIPESLSISSNATSIKELIINVEFVHLSFNGWMKMMQHFPSLESLKFNVSLENQGMNESEDDYYDGDRIDTMAKILDFYKTVTPLWKVPPKVTFSFGDSVHWFHGLGDYKWLCEDYEYHETKTIFACFRRTISSVGPHPILFEVQIPKQRSLLSLLS